MADVYIEVDGDDVEFSDATFDPDGEIDVHNAPQLVVNNPQVDSLVLLFENGLI